MPKEVLICLTGGGTAGHVMPHFALVPEMNKRGWRYYYIGSFGMEQDLVKGQGIEYFAIRSGKFRRYLSAQNFFDIFNVIMGFFQALLILSRKRPNLVFSKGGFVSVPVCLAAWSLRIPVITHESDLTPGLATKIIGKFASHVLFSFPESGHFFPEPKGKFVGAPIRTELFSGDPIQGAKVCGFSEVEKIPVILVMGGSLGAQNLNQILFGALPELVKDFKVIHLTGKGKSIGFTHARYKAFEYLDKELKDVMALSDFIVSRAGANSIFEFLSLRKPMLLIPLEAGSRGDQVVNAECFVKEGWALCKREAELDPSRFLAAVSELKINGVKIQCAQEKYPPDQAKERILELLSSII